ncbi:hypothetical protein Trydic_g16250 [Trypoxylus dichotomus]
METSMATQKEIAREPILVSSVNKHIQNASRNVPSNIDSSMSTRARKMNEQSSSRRIRKAGVVSCKKRAQEAIHYPGVISDIEELVLGCNICHMYSKSNPREPLFSHEIPERPWQKIGMDFNALRNLDFLVIVDYYSKFTVVNWLNSKTFFDNGPPFNSKKFHIFAKEYGIELVTSSPHYARPNGMVERTIQTIKGLLVKSF